MAKYSVTLTRIASTTASLGGFNATATARRGKLYECTLGADAVPGDNTLLFRLQRYTAAGTSTAVTPQAIDPGDTAAALMAAGQNHSAEPTYVAGAIMLSVPMNQRATFRWVAPPGGEIVFPATSANGLGMQTPVAGGTPSIVGDFKIEEQ